MRMTFKTLLLGVAITSVLGVAGCRSGIVDSQRSGKGSGEENSGDGGDDGGDDGFETATDSTPIAGVNLTYNGGRVRCDYKQIDDDQYDVLCAAVTVQKTGQEVKATTLEKDLTVTWGTPIITSGIAEAGDCEESKNKLSQTCRFTVPTGVSAAKIKMIMSLSQAATKETRTETTSIVLPYAVSVAAGLVPNIPFAYQTGKALPASAALTTEIKQGFQSLGMAPDALTFGGIGSSCWRAAGDLFFTQSAYLYRYKDGKITLWAGSTRTVSAKTDFSHRLRVGLGDVMTGLLCEANAIIVSDGKNHRILRLSDDGPVELIAGTGISGVAADGAVASTSKLAKPSGLARSADGLLYFSETNNHLVRYIDKNGKLQTVSNAFTAPQGLAFAADGKTLYVADSSQHKVIRISATGQLTVFAGTGTAANGGTYVTTGAASTNPFINPWQLAFDAAGTLYVSEFGVGIRRISSSGAISPGVFYTDLVVDSVAATGTSVFSGLSIGPDDKAYFGWARGLARWTGADTASAVIGNAAEPTTPEGCSVEVAGDTARFNFASGLGFDADGKIVLADWRSDDTAVNDIVVKQIAPDSDGKQQVSTIFGCTPNALLTGNRSDGTSGNYGVASMALLPSGSMLFANALSHKIIKLDPSNNGVTTFAGTGTDSSTGNGGQATAATFSGPSSMAVMSDGSVLVAEQVGFRIRKIAANGIVSAVAGTGVTGGDGDGGQATSAKLIPSSVVVGSDGTIYVADWSHRIRRIKTNGVIDTIAGNGTAGTTGNGGVGTSALVHYPRSMAIDNNDVIYFIDGIDSTTTRPVVRRLLPNANGSFNIELFFGDGDNRECATNRVSGQAANQDEAIRASMGVMCLGKPYSLAILDECPTAGGKTRMIISQGFNEYSNVIEIERACN